MKHHVSFICISVLLLSLIISPSLSMENKNNISVPSKGAIILFDGKDTSSWIQANGRQPFGWMVTDGYMEVKPGTGDIMTRRNFKDFQLHVEFNVPHMPKEKGQARGNSGVILQNLYEIQVLDSYQIKKPSYADCGAIYRQKAPDKEADGAPDTWQTYDITFSAPRFDAAGQITRKPRVTVYQNGIKIQDNVELKGPTGMRSHNPMTEEGPVILQDHHARVKYRNIWLLPNIKTNHPSRKEN